MKRRLGGDLHSPRFPEGLLAGELPSKRPFIRRYRWQACLPGSDGRKTRGNCEGRARAGLYVTVSCSHLQNTPIPLRAKT